MRIVVVGLGKIGLPLAVQFASKGHVVTGLDIDGAVVDAANRASAASPGEAGLESALSRVVASGMLRATTDYSQAIPGSEVVVVVVPLVVDRQTFEPDFSAVDAATELIGLHMTPETLVVYETTLPVGTTRHRWAPMLEQASGLRQGVDFHVAFSPERVFTGRVFADLRKYPKLVGGLSAAGAERTVQFYESVLDFDDRPDLSRPNGVWDLGTPEAAEMAKLAETTYRDVNIALANQFALFAERNGIDVHEVIAASNSQPFSHIHQPGIAVGGHCIPVYPRLYLFNDPEATVVRAAREANERMPLEVVSRLGEALGSLEGLRVALLGISYRGGVKEDAFSGVYPVAEALAAAGAGVVVHDPLYDAAEIESLGFTPYVLGTTIDAAIIQADHAEYGQLTAGDLPGVRAMVDGRALLDRATFEPVPLLTVGRPGGRSP